ncbi:polymorphic toxin-type HINT domain-containing protein [Ferruginibacter profundus]
MLEISQERGYKAIEKIKVGDKVWSYNILKKRRELKKVVKTYSLKYNELYKLYIGKNLVAVTYEHPFFVKNKWVKANQLKVGDSIITYNIDKKPIDSIVIVRGEFNVYNFVVAGNHNYYVSENKVLVHNGPPCNFGFTWQKAGTVLADKLAKGIHGDVYHKGRQIGEAAFKASADGERIIAQVALIKKKAPKNAASLIVKYGDDTIAQGTPFYEDLLRQTTDAINSGSFKGTNRLLKLENLQATLQKILNR